MANPKDPFNRITNPDGTPVRDKDNAQPQLKPSNQNLRPAPNLAPAGATGIRQSPRSNLVPEKTRIQFRTSNKALVPQQGKANDKAGLSIDQGDKNNDLLIKGRIITMSGYTFAAKMYDEPSKRGIGEGKISKLQVKKDGEQVMNFDRGWDDKPKTTEHREALQRIRNGLDDGPTKDIMRPDHGPGKSPDIDH